MRVIEINPNDGSNRKTIIPINKIECVLLIPAYNIEDKQCGWGITISTGSMTHNNHFETEENAMKIYDSIMDEIKLEKW